MPAPMAFDVWLAKTPKFHLDASTGDTVQGECSGYSVAKDRKKVTDVHKACKKVECANVDYFHKMRTPVLEYLMSVFAASTAATTITLESILSEENRKIVSDRANHFAAQRTYEDLEEKEPKLLVETLRDIDVMINYSIIGLMVHKAIIQKRYFQPNQMILAMVPRTADEKLHKKTREKIQLHVSNMISAQPTLQKQCAGLRLDGANGGVIAMSGKGPALDEKEEEKAMNGKDPALDEKDEKEQEKAKSNKRKRTPSQIAVQGAHDVDVDQIQLLFEKFPCDTTIMKIGWLTDWIHYVSKHVHSKYIQHTKHCTHTHDHLEKFGTNHKTNVSQQCNVLTTSYHGTQHIIQTRNNTHCIHHPIGGR